MLEQTVPEGLQLVEEGPTMEQFVESCCLWDGHSEEVCGGRCPLEETPHWSRGRPLLPEQQQEKCMMN